MNELSKDLETALKAARAAAQIIIKNYSKTQNSHVKDGAKGLVTETDLEADETIVQILKANSGYPILSEESGLSGETDGPIWVIDPLDGTNNFARSIPLFGTSVGLLHGKESLLGVIIDPVHQKEYYATKESEAFCNGEPIRLPAFDTDYIPMIFLNHGYDEIHRERFKKFTAATASEYNTLKLGTTVIELAQVATGAVDAFICTGDELWDFAAGMVITQQAGCIFTDWQGNPWDGKTSQLLVSRPEVHPRLIEIIKNI